MAWNGSRQQARLYGKLLVIYPTSYRLHYRQPMVQAFEDMLDDQKTAQGKWAVWLRTLWDLPGSAIREHVTQGEDVRMSRNMKILVAGAILLLVLANGVSWWYGNLHSRQTSGIEKVSVAQIADAMQQDRFFSSYGNAGLLFSGKITTIQQKDTASLVTFATNRPYSVVCQFPNANQLASGSKVSVAAPGGSAERLSHGVLLHDCIVN